jgi:tetratricopeptide (TPR) repeat protein
MQSVNEELLLQQQRKDAEETEKKLLLSCLTSGSIQSFCELNLLVKRPRLGKEDAGETPEVMAFIRDQLVRGEQGRQSGRLGEAVTSYLRVGETYANGGQHKLAVFYLEHALDYARRAGDTVGEMEALHRLGIELEALGEFSEALNRHNARLHIAESSTSLEGRDEAIKMSAFALVRVYGIQASISEKHSSKEESLNVHLQALNVSKHCGDLAAVARANYNVGRASVMVGKGSVAIPYLETYLNISKTRGDATSTAQALAALAAANQAVGNKDVAVSYLSQLLEVAVETGSAAAEAEASEQLGIMLAGAKETMVEAEMHLSRAFELRRSSIAEGKEPRSSIDKVRILLGMVRGDARLSPLFSRISEVDMSALLNWRIQRTEPPTK